MMPTRIGLLALYWSAFDATMPPAYRLEREEFAKDILEVLRSIQLEVVYPGLVLDESTGLAAGETFSSVDAIVVVPTMACPPAFAWAALSKLPEVPVVIWNVATLSELPGGFDAEDLVRQSSNVGTVMLSNVLRRQGRRFRVCTVRKGVPDSFAPAIAVVRSAAVASRLRKARLGMIGGSVAGYLNVALDSRTLKETLGIELIEISQSEHESTYSSVTQTETDHVLSEIADWKSVGISHHDRECAARLSAALAKLVSTNQLDGGSLNCRTTFFLDNPLIGIVACVAVSYLLRQGTAFTCTGDVPASIAVLILKLLGLPAQWCECNVVDFAGDYVLLSTMGEGDQELASDCKGTRLIPNRRFRPEGCGPCLQYSFAAGPATLIGFSPQPSAVGGWTLVIAAGELIDRYFPALGVPNGAFTFQSNAAASLDAWYEAGPTHHAVLTRGKQTDMLTNVAYFLGIEARCI